MGNEKKGNALEFLFRAVRSLSVSHWAAWADQRVASRCPEGKRDEQA